MKQTKDALKVADVDRKAGVTGEVMTSSAGTNGADADEILYIGIDLGTSRSSIATSNGIRITIPSVVGYPKDEVARKLLGKEMVFGDDAVEHRLSLNLFRPLEKGVIRFSEDAAAAREETERYLQAAGDLIHHLVSLARPMPGQKVFGVIGAPAQASIHNKKAIIRAAREVLDSVLITSEPFSVAYGLDRLDGALVIDIGAGTVDLCRMHGAFPDADDQITLTTAGDYVDEVLFKLLKRRYDAAQFNINMVRQLKEKFSFVGHAGDSVEVLFPVNGRPVRHDVTEDLATACATVIDPIMESVHRLLATFDPEFQERLRQNVILAGGGSQITGLGKLLEERLSEFGGGKVRVVEEPVYAGANGSLKLACEMPAKYWEALR